MRHANLIRGEITTGIEEALSEHAKSFVGKVADNYFEALKARVFAAAAPAPTT